MKQQEQFALTSQESINAPIELAKSAFDSVIKLNTLNIESMRSLFEENMNLLNTLLKAKDFSALANLPETMAKSGEIFTAYTKNVAKIMTESRDALMQTSQSQISLNEKAVSAASKSLRKAA